MTEMIYSTQIVANAGGRKVQNPVHFVSPEPDVKRVYVQDGYDNVRVAYREAGVEVKSLWDLPAPQAAAPAASAKKKE